MHPKLKELTSSQIEEELKLCEKFPRYFYNNYCRAEGMPEYSEENFNNYLKLAKEKRNLYLLKQRRSGPRPNIIQHLEMLREHPLSMDDIIRNQL